MSFHATGVGLCKILFFYSVATYFSVLFMHVVISVKPWCDIYKYYVCNSAFMCIKICV